MKKDVNTSITMIDLGKLTRALEDLNSKFPATSEFLRSKGLENVRDLTERDRKELIAHLTKKYHRLLH